MNSTETDEVTQSPAPESNAEEQQKKEAEVVEVDLDDVAGGKTASPYL